MPSDDRTIHHKQVAQKPLMEVIGKSDHFHQEHEETCGQERKEDVARIDPLFLADRLLKDRIQFIMLRFDMIAVSLLSQNGSKDREKVVGEHQDRQQQDFRMFHRFCDDFDSAGGAAMTGRNKVYSIERRTGGICLFPHSQYSNEIPKVSILKQGFPSRKANEEETFG